MAICSIRPSYTNRLRFCTLHAGIHWILEGLFSFMFVFDINKNCMELKKYLLIGDGITCYITFGYMCLVLLVSCV